MGVGRFSHGPFGPFADFYRVNAKLFSLDGWAGRVALAACIGALAVVLLVTGALLTGAGPAGAQNAVVTCRGQDATIVGTTGNDTLRGTSGRDVIAALGGDDVIYGLAGNDLICGGHGHDTIYGGDGADGIFGFNGADELHGGKGPDRLVGGVGADLLNGNNGQDILRGGPGFDELRGGSQRDSLQGGTHIDNLFGGSELDECYSPRDVLAECERGGGIARTGAAVSTAVLDDQFAAEMFRLINVERANVGGLAPLSRSAELDRYANEWTVTMSQQPLPLDRLRHHSPAFTGSDIAFQEIPDSRPWTHAFENVGYSQIGSNDSVESVVERLFYSPNGSGFTTSPGHQCNILETAADEVGVGAFVDASGALWVAQLFWGVNDNAPTPVTSCQSVASR